MITLLPRRTGASRLLLALAIPLALAALFPTLYLALRAAQVPPDDAAAYLTRSGTLRVIGRSLLLVGAVSLAAAAIGIPAAWLTVRTDLRARRLWTIALTVPLVIPSYVAALALVGAFGQRGFVQGWLA
ncbi:MAG: iron ABC transporter permease, partial [Chloroflexota bacterium]